jgi:hypothetical protein
VPLNRLVAFILGPVITLVAGYVSLWLSRHFPGAHLPDQKSIAGVITSGVVTVVPMILAHKKIQQWLHGWQAWEKRQDDAVNGALDLNFKLFLERVAAKTGVELPTGETITEADIGAPVKETPTGPPQPPAAAGADAQETGDIFTPDDAQ